MASRLPPSIDKKGEMQDLTREDIANDVPVVPLPDLKEKINEADKALIYLRGMRAQFVVGDIVSSIEW